MNRKIEHSLTFVTILADIQNLDNAYKKDGQYMQELLTPKKLLWSESRKPH